MATFVWPSEVQWPPPAHILLNYDVVAPGGAVLSLSRASEMEEKRMPYLALITPLTGNYPDQGLPGGGQGGPIDPGWGVSPPADPGYGRPEGPGRPDYIWGQRPPHVGGGPVYPGYPSGQPVPGGGRPDNTLPGAMPQGGTEVPPDVMPPPPVPEEIASQYIVSVYNPKTMTWTTKSYPPPAA